MIRWTLVRSRAFEVKVTIDSRTSAVTRYLVSLLLRTAVLACLALLFSYAGQSRVNESLWRSLSGVSETALADAPQSVGSGSVRSRVQGQSQVQVKERTDNITKKQKGAESLREKRESGGRRLNRSEIQRIASERQLSGALSKEIKYAEQVLKKLPANSPQRPRILQRLIENYHQRSLLVFFAESRKYDREWKAWDKGGRKGKEPTLDMTASTAWTSKVVQKAQQMITEYPKDPEIDEAYFQIAYALDTLGKRKEAAAYYSQLVGKFPNSQRVADSHFAVGEFYFDQTDFRKALTSFKEAAKFTRSSIYPWAFYKLAWSYFNLNDYRNSLGAFQNTVRIAAQARKLTKEGRERLKEEALRDMVNVYAALRDINGAERYFSQVGGQKYFGELLTKLAEALREQGQFEQSIAVLKRFISRNPTEINAADVQIQIVDTANLLADKRLMWAELRSLLKNYNPDSLWGKKNASHPDYKDLQNRVHDVAISYPKEMHSAAQKSNNKYLFGQAALGYQLYLQNFGSRPEADEIRFLLGEIQYQQEQYPAARQTFWQLAEKGKKTEYFLKSAQYLLSASYLPIEEGMKRMRAAGAKLEQPKRDINPAVQEYLKVCKKISVWFPTSNSVKDCELDEAEIYLKHNHYPEAEEALWKVAKKYASGKEGQDAAELLLWLASKDSKKLVKVSGELAKIKEYKSGDIGKRISAIDETNQFQETLELEKSGDFLKAAERFEKLARSNPRGNETDKAWFNAGVNYRKAGEASKAISAYAKVYTDFPKTQQAADAMLAVIEIADEQLRIDEAASLSLKFVERYPQDKRSAVVTREACFLYEALNQVSGAERACGIMIKSGGKAGGEASESLARVYRRNGRYQDLVSVTDKYLMRLPLNPTQKIEVLASAAEAERKLGRRGNAARRDQQIISLFNANKGRVTGEALSHAGRIAYESNAGLLAKFRESKLQARKADGSDLQASITTKQALLQNLEKSFQSVIATGDSEWGVAAMFTIGASYEVFANDLKNAPLPSALPEDVKKQYRAEFEKLSAAPAQKALAYYKQAAETVAKFGVYNDFSQKNIEALTRLEPSNYRPVDEWLPSSLFVGTRWSDAGPAGRVFRYVGGGN